MQEGIVVKELLKCCSQQVKKKFSNSSRDKVTEEYALSKLEQITVRPGVKMPPGEKSDLGSQLAADNQSSPVTAEDRLTACVSSELPPQLQPQGRLPEPDNHHENLNIENNIFYKIQNSKEVSSNKERIGATHPGSYKRGINKKSKKVGLPTHDNGEIAESMVLLVMTLLTGSVILSSLPSGQGQVSHAQVAAVSQGKLVMGHHVYHKSRGWLKQAARVKPMVRLYSRLDMSAYKALRLKPPAKQIMVSSGEHLADTGASICLGGRSYLRSLGLSEEDLTPCDMSMWGQQ